MKKTNYVSFIGILIFCSFLFCFSSCGGAGTSTNDRTNEREQQIQEPSKAKTDELPQWLKGRWGIKQQIGYSFEYIVEVRFKSNGTLDFVMAGLPQETCSFDIPSGSNMIVFNYCGKTLELYYDNSRKSLKSPTGRLFERS
ncbi:hypothetical protein [Dysgonomonas sp. 520]|uniref:hypothetical protein n=1 Tax=Dysgonomonas sp. 520 TaxID=2302931 RepID=UPI0013D29C7C|nr:hypothetical protein [Dysgonomonas sp. 520]NDW11231.1 hypothetical protein [Dysgonomonas sp. 520]